MMWYKVLMLLYGELLKDTIWAIFFYFMCIISSQSDMLKLVLHKENLLLYG